MTSPAELDLRLAGLGITENLEIFEPDRPDIGAVLQVWPIEGSDGALRAACHIRSDLGDERRARVMAYLHARICAFADIGPEADGWQPMRDGVGWQVRAQEVMLAPLND
jgi:hypothetical protein